LETLCHEPEHIGVEYLDRMAHYDPQSMADNSCAIERRDADDHGDCEPWGPSPAAPGLAEARVPRHSLGSGRVLARDSTG
jgi:hypothetical protein